MLHHHHQTNTQLSYGLPVKTHQYGCWMKDLTVDCHSGSANTVLKRTLYNYVMSH